MVTAGEIAFDRCYPLTLGWVTADWYWHHYAEIFFPAIRNRTMRTSLLTSGSIQDASKILFLPQRRIKPRPAPCKITFRHW